MNLDDFYQSLAEPEPPPGLTPAGLWWDAKDIARKASGLRGVLGIDKTVFRKESMLSKPLILHF